MGAAIAVAVGAFALAGTLGTAAAAANGIDASHKKREDEEDPHAQPHSNDPPRRENPPPVVVPPPVNNPPTDPNAVTHFLEGLRTGKIGPVEKPIFDLSYKGQSNATPPPVTPPPTSNPTPNPNALNNFLEGLRTGKIEPAAKPVFDLSHKSDSAITASPVAPPPVANPPVNPNALNNFIEGLRTGKIEPVAKPVFDLSHKSDGGAAMVPVVPPVSTSSPEVSAHFANAITTPLENLRSGTIEPTSKPSFDLSPKSHSAAATDPVAPPPSGNSLADAGAQLKSTIVSYLEILQQNAIHLSTQFSDDSSLNINAPLQSAIANYLETIQCKAIDQASPTVNPSADKSGSIPGAIVTVLETLGTVLEPFRPLYMDLLSPLLPSFTSPLKSCHVRSEGIRLPNMRIGFINGMDTSYEEFMKHLAHTQKFVGELSIDGVYNHSNGRVCDFIESLFFNYAGIAPVTSTLLLENWTQFHEENKDNLDAKYLQFTHSQGTIQAKATLEKAPQEIRNRVIVVSVGSAAAIPEEWCNESFPYASKNDLVHLGEDVHAFYVGESFEEPQRIEIIKQLEENKRRLILLEPHPDAKKGMDHEYESPTFDEIKRKHIQTYLEKKIE